MALYKVRFWGRLRSLQQAFALATFALLALSSSSNAAIRFDAIIGYSGVSPQNAWFPITCELQNTGPTFTGVIEVAIDQLANSQTRRLRLELPSNTIKRVVIPVFASSRYNKWSVRLLDDSGKVRAEPNYIGAQRVSGYPAMGVLSRAVAGVPSFPDIKVRSPERQPLAVRLQPELFPDNPIVLDGVPVIYLNSERAMGLTVPQVNALLAWLQHGGHLVVGVEQVADLTATEWLHKILPCELTSTATLQAHGEFQQFIHEFTVKPDQPELTPDAPSQPNPQRPRRVNGRVAPVNTSRPTPELSGVDMIDDSGFESAPLQVLKATIRDGQAVLSNGSTPLIIQANRGRGRITVLTFSPEREPFLSWKNRAWFWTKLAGVPTQLYKSTEFLPEYGRLSSDGVFGSMIDSKQVRKLPLGWLLVLLGAYLVVIGPLDQYWLKKINRQMLTWITFPIYVLAFSGLIYLIGFYLRAGDLEYNELSVVDILPNNHLAVGSTPDAERVSVADGETAVLRGQTYCSIYSPVNAHYPLVSEQPFATLRGEFVDVGGGQSSRANVLQRGNAFEADTFVSVWTSQLFVSDWLQSIYMPLVVNVTPVDRNWSVTVENKTERKLTRAHIVLMGRVYVLGDLLPQKTNTFALNTEQGKLISEFANNNGINLRGAAEARRASFGNNRTEIPDIAIGSMAASFASMLNQRGDTYNNFATPQGLDLSDLAQRGQGILLAWDENHSFAPAMNRFSSRRLNRNTLLRLVLPMKQKPSTL